MPLLDHFHQPILSRLPWASLHSGWATYLASHLIEHWLPPPYLAVEHAQHGRVEIDPDRFEILVYADSAGWELVGAIELVSPGNKHRPEERRAFVAKCANYLHLGVSLVLLDIVTSHHFNLHNQLLEFLGVVTGLLPADVNLYAAGYRPVSRQNRPEMDVWAEPCAVGRALPTLPLRLTGDLVVPVEFEKTYEEICTRRRVI
jgi:hypothetical protein